MDEIQKAFALSVRAGEVLLRSGAEIFRVQETVFRIASHYHIRSLNVYVVSNGLFVSMEEDEQVRGAAIRNVPLSTVHLGRVAAVNNLSREIEAGKYTVEEAMRRLDEIKDLPFTANWLQILASGVGSASFCILFGGSFLDSVAAFAAGLILWALVLLAGAKGLSKIISTIASSMAVALCSILLFKAGVGNQIDKIIIGSIVPLLPGVPLTTAIRDFLNGDYLSGVIHMTDALLVAACIAIGVGVMLKLGNAFLGVAL